MIQTVKQWIGPISNVEGNRQIQSKSWKFDFQERIQTMSEELVLVTSISLRHGSI